MIYNWKKVTMIFNFQIFSILFTVCLILLDCLIMNYHLVLKKYYPRCIKYYLIFRRLPYYMHNIIYFCIFIIILLLFFGSINDLIISSFICNVTDKNNDVNIGSNATVNINNPNLNASVSTEGVNNIAAAISAAGGATAGIKVAQLVGGPPSMKIMAGLGTMGVVQATSGIMSKVLNSNSKKTSLIYSSSFINNYNYDLTNYPLNLLSDVNLLLYAGLIFLFIIINIHIINYLSKIDYIKYIEKLSLNIKWTNRIKWFITRYLNIFNKNNKFILIYCYIMLFLVIILSKICLFIILNKIK